MGSYVEQLWKELGRPLGRLPRGVCRRAVENYIATQGLVAGVHDIHGGPMFRVPQGTNFELVRAGAQVEDTQAILEELNRQLEETKSKMQALVNDIHVLAEVVEPRLMEHVREVRSTRQTVVSEIAQMLSSLRDIRKFFLEDDFEVEIGRLERFVRLCREIRQLKQDGTFDAVCDSSLRLAVKEVKP